MTNKFPVSVIPLEFQFVARSFVSHGVEKLVDFPDKLEVVDVSTLCSTINS